MAQLINIDELPDKSSYQDIPVQLGQKFTFNRIKCQVVVRYPHAFDYITPDIPPQPMEKKKQITYAFWRKEFGRKIHLLHP